MPNYTNLTARSSSNPPAMVADDVSALIPEDVQHEIIQGVTVKSAALQLFKTRNMGRKQQRLPVLSAKPTAYFVSGDTGLIQTTEVNWTNVYLNAEEVACIVPVPKTVLDDVDYDLWGEIQPQVEEALAVALDEAVFFGVNAPSSWPSSVAVAATAASNTVTRGAGVDVAADLNAAMSLVEADGFVNNGFLIRPTLKGVLRGLRAATTNELIFQSETQGVESATFLGRIWGEKSYISMAGFAAFVSTGGAGFYEAITGDWSQGIIGIRQDLSMQKFDSGVIQDGSGNIVFNLMQQNMIALRVIARYAFAVPNPISRVNTNNSTRYPFAVLRQT